VIATKVSAALPPLAGDDPRVCRKPQHLKGSRLLGPMVCLKISEWAALQAQGRTVLPDGRATAALINYEPARSVFPSGCSQGAPAVGGATAGFHYLPRTACF
jgi:hypothetical protein